METKFIEAKRQFEILCNEFSSQRNAIYRPDYKEITGHSAAIAALLDGLPIETAKKILTAAIAQIELAATVQSEEIYKKFGSRSS